MTPETSVGTGRELDHWADWLVHGRGQTLPDPGGSDHRMAVLNQRDHQFRSARLPPAIPTEVPIRWIGLAVAIAVGLFAAPRARRSKSRRYVA
jgi:hypothetical protein